MRKKFSGATFVENALIIALVIIAAIGGLGYLGQSIREQLGFIFDEAAQRKNQIHHATESTLIENGKAEEDASRIANAAADAAAAAYRAALDAGDSPELANKAAAWAAYTAAYGQMFWSYTAIEEAEQAYWESEARQAYDTTWETAWQTFQDSGVEQAYDAARNALSEAYEQAKLQSYAASEAAYKSAWETFNDKESSIEELIRDRAYSGMLGVATTILTVLSESQNVTLDVSVIATDLANQFSKGAYDTYFEVADSSSPSWEMACQLGYMYMYEPLVSAAQNAGLTWRNDTPSGPVVYMASDAAAAIFGSDYAIEAAGLSFERRLELARWAERMRNGD